MIFYIFTNYNRNFDLFGSCQFSGNGNSQNEESTTWMSTYTRQNGGL